MSVNGSRPDGAPTDAGDAGWAEGSSHGALRERARAVVEAARETVAHSQELRWLLEDPHERGFVSRCVWCRRFRLGERWLDAGARLRFGVGRTMLTVCDDCADALREAGSSA
jgi:hypothetical protein